MVRDRGLPAAPPGRTLSIVGQHDEDDDDDDKRGRARRRSWEIEPNKFGNGSRSEATIHLPNRPFACRIN